MKLLKMSNTSHVTRKNPINNNILCHSSVDCYFHNFNVTPDFLTYMKISNVDLCVFLTTKYSLRAFCYL